MAGTEERNAELMQTLDDAWNAQDVEVFRARHKPDVVVRWPGQPEPTVGIEDHEAESIAFWKTFPDQKLDNRPYKVFFASGDWACKRLHTRGRISRDRGEDLRAAPLVAAGEGHRVLDLSADTKHGARGASFVRSPGRSLRVTFPLPGDARPCGGVARRRARSPGAHSGCSRIRPAHRPQPRGSPIR